MEENKEVKADETAKTSDAISGYSIIEDYLKAIGGRAEVQKVNTISSTLKMEAMGRELTGRDIRMNPDKLLLEIKMGEITISKTLFNGITGYKIRNGVKTDMTPEEIKEQQDRKGVLPQLYFNAAAYKTEYLGKGKVEEEETYRLKVEMPSGKIAVQQYSIKTGLLVEEETTFKQGDAEIPVTIGYKNYQKIGSIMFPTQVIRNVGEQEFTSNYTDIKFNEGISESDFK